MTFTIDLVPRTKKNSQRIVRAKGHYLVLPSKAYAEYEKAAEKFIPKLGIDYPVNIKAYFYMPTRRRVDLVNLQESLCDVLVKHGCIKDDNCSIVVSMDGSRVMYSKESPCTVVTIERSGDK